MSDLLPRYSVQSVNPDCSISIIHGGRVGITFIMLSDTVNIIWILASAKCVNEISPTAVGKGTSGPLLFVHSTLRAEAIYFWILKDSYWRAKKRTIFATFTQSDIGHRTSDIGHRTSDSLTTFIHLTLLNSELNTICYLLALLGAHHFLHVSRIRVKLLTFMWLMSYIWSTHSWCF